MRGVFYCFVNGHGLVLNNVNSPRLRLGLVRYFPEHTFYQIGARYPDRVSLQTKMRAIADSWLRRLRP